MPGAYFTIVLPSKENRLPLTDLKLVLFSLTVILVSEGHLINAFSFTLAIFNLLPIYPLDGFNVLRVCVKGQSKVLNFLERYGNIIMFVFIVSPIFSIILSFLESNVLLPLLTLWAAIL